MLRLRRWYWAKLEMVSEPLYKQYYSWSAKGKKPYLVYPHKSSHSWITPISYPCWLFKYFKMALPAWSSLPFPFISVSGHSFCIQSICYSSENNIQACLHMCLIQNLVLLISRKILIQLISFLSLTCFCWLYELRRIFDTSETKMGK